MAIWYLDIKAIELVPQLQPTKEIYLIFLVVPKKNRDVWGILDLKWLNCCIQRWKFKMETLRTIMAAIQKEDFLASMEAHLHVPLKRSLQIPKVHIQGKAFSILGPAIWAQVVAQSVHKGDGDPGGTSQDAGSVAVSIPRGSVRFVQLRLMFYCYLFQSHFGKMECGVFSLSNNCF